MVANVCEVGKVVEERWCELLDRGFMIRSVLEFPRSMYYRGHPHKKLRVNTFYRYEDRSTNASVDEFCNDNQHYETAPSFFPRPNNPKEVVFNRHMKRVSQLIAVYEDQVRRGELPHQE